ncbi:helix-turn-helix domain-containing protein [Aquimarina sp. AU474]|uniref:helix-turn-helix domain-containing protein n=1 Tax=Aquimarina sp. AU474 TaxID=2108529 RepID=UPI00135A2C45|nr:helix-turn-helix domain-containing protein [Aquimarina sp. AU474]
MIIQYTFLPSRVYIVLATLLLCMIGYAQETQLVIPDSIAQLSSKQLVHTLKTTKPIDSKIYEEALIQKTKQGQVLATYYFDIGLFSYTQENFVKAVYYLRKAIFLLKETEDDELLCTAYLKLGNSYLKDWKNQQALDAYYTALEIIDRNGHKEDAIRANSGIIMIRRRMKQLDKALEVCKYTLRLTENSTFKNQKNHVNMLTILNEIFLTRKQYDSVLHYTDIGIFMSEPISYHIGTIDLYTKKGTAYLEKKDVPRAFENLRIAQSLLENNKVTEKKSILNLNYFLARCYYEQEEYTQAISYLEKTKAVIDQKDARNERVLDIYKLLAKCNNKLGNKEESAFWFQKFTELQTRFLEERDQTFNKMYNKDTQELGDAIKALETQQERDARLKKYGIVFLIALLLAFVVVGGVYYRKQQTNKSRFEKLIQKISELESQGITNTHTTKEITKEVVIDDEKIDKVLKGLGRLEDQEYFLNLDCNLRNMAKKVKTNATYLSKIINTYKEKSFNDYINDLRIEYVLKRLKNDRKFRSFSISSIASEIGYKSDNSFTKHFKAKTGLNPSYYIKNIEKLEQQSVS